MRRVIFSHIPKTAGTSVRVHLVRALPPGPRLAVHFGQGGILPSDWPEAPVPDDWVLLSGHLRPEAICANPAIRSDDATIVFLAVLRDPIARLLSLYDYVRATPTHPAHERMHSVPLEKFLIGQPADYQHGWLATLGSTRWRVVLTDVASLPAGLAALASAAELPDPERVASLKLHLNKTPQQARAAPRDPLRAELEAELRARHARDCSLLAAIADAGGALTGLPAM